jgi:hypothetical protein
VNVGPPELRRQWPVFVACPNLAWAQAHYDFCFLARKEKAWPLGQGTQAHQEYLRQNGWRRWARPPSSYARVPCLYRTQRGQKGAPPKVWTPWARKRQGELRLEFLPMGRAEPLGFLLRPAPTGAGIGRLPAGARLRRLRQTHSAEITSVDTPTRPPDRL